jgi:hypothetical protein
MTTAQGGEEADSSGSPAANHAGECWVTVLTILCFIYGLAAWGSRKNQDVVVLSLRC